MVPAGLVPANTRSFTRFRRNRGVAHKNQRFPTADGDAAIHLRGDVEIVGGDDGGKPGRAHQLPERAEHVIGGVDVEIAGRLVGEQDARRVGDRARYRHALLLAAR